LPIPTASAAFDRRSLSEQLLRKRDIVARALAAYPSLAHLEVPSVIASPHRLGYRARVKLVVRSTKGEVATGLYVPGSHRVIDFLCQFFDSESSAL
jgi:tRNA/tmRNA/rRNA uracil-C5-methylase (TrmA/RlmC/RlmD family)